MSRTLKRYHVILKPLSEEPVQVYLGTEVHQLGLLSWILDQTGKAEVIVTTFSTSDDFLSGFIRLKKDGLISHSTLLADFKASRKTLTLGTLMRNAFDRICFGENHSKLMLIEGANLSVCVVTSQNQTYGGRNESTLITTDLKCYFNFKSRVMDIINNHSVNYQQWMQNKSTSTKCESTENDSRP